jgi:putative tryptophan/tyrosine transport system substrate-binding protein
MQRREFISFLGGAAAWPLAARAQQNDRMKRIGVLVAATTEHDPESEVRVAAFRRGLEELGWVDGRNIRIDYRFAGGDADRIRTYVAELVKSAPDLIVANSSLVVAELKRNTGTIPIVFAVVTDPVNQGFVTNLARPGGNITGFTLIEFEIIGKWLGLLKEMAPRVNRAKLLFDPGTAPSSRFGCETSGRCRWPLSNLRRRRCTTGPGSKQPFPCSRASRPRG